MELDQPDVDYVMDLARKQAAEVSNPVKKVKEQRLGGEKAGARSRFATSSYSK